MTMINQTTTMKHTIEQVLRDVRMAMRMNPQAPDSPIPASQLSLDQWITSRLPAAVRAEHIRANVSVFDSPLPFASPIVWADTATAAGSVALPNDFMRLVAFKMSDWDMPVTSASSIGSTQYMRQSSPYPGVRGNPCRPVCAIVPAPAGRRLEFYSCRDTLANVEQALYMPEPVIAPDSTIDIAPACYAAVIDNIAAMWTGS